MNTRPVLSERASLSAFMNALWREWSPAKRLPAENSNLSGQDGTLCLPLTRPEGVLQVPLQYFSLSGRHRFDGTVHFVPAGGPAFAIDFAQTVSLLAGEPALAPDIDDSTRRRFLLRVLDSAATLLDADADHQAPSWPDAGFLAAEQGLVYGHAVHPTPKSRDEFTREDHIRYSPDFGGHTPLVWFAVQAGALWQARPGSSFLPDALITSDPGLSTMMTRYPHSEGWQWLPVHPWQAGVLRRAPAYHHWRSRDALIDLGEAGTDWFPTSSLRTLYSPHAPAMLKFSLSVRIANSRRVLRMDEVMRGQLVRDIFSSKQGKALRHRCPTLGILHEHGALALTTLDGHPLAESFVIFRDNPFPPDCTSYVMATLYQEGANGTASMVSRLIVDLAAQEQRPLTLLAMEWFDCFLSVALKPLLIAQADYGFLFSAHQQNTVLTLKSGWPAGIWLRDGQGAAFHPETIAELTGQIPGIRSASTLAFNETMANHLLGYYLIVNNVLSLIATLGADGLVDEMRLAERLRHSLLALRRTSPRFPHFIDYLLDSPMLMSKGNFMLSLRGLDETANPEDSFRSYVPLRNPIAAAANPESHH
ncbi:IucA/IucC family protein [Microvirgula curvata]